MTNCETPPSHGTHRTTTARRIVVVALAATLLAAASGAAGCGDDGAAPGPNVLLVILDTTRADRCGLHGYPRPTTPALDAFARDAVTFDDAWSQGSWTIPAHAALFTGMDPHHLDLYQGDDAKLRGSTTIAEALGQGGWETAAFSANPWIAPHTDLTRGFTTIRKVPQEFERFASAAEVTNAARAWIRARPSQARPFFAFINVMEPHAPYDPPAAETDRMLRPGLAPASVAAARRLTSPRGLMKSSLTGVPLDAAVDAAISDLYDAEVATADAALGGLLDDLRADGTLDRTLVVIASDHGEGLGDHGWREHGVMLHRELLRVPLIVRMPGRFDGGRRVPGLVRLIDVAPTVLAACGLPPAGPLDGRDLSVPAEGHVALATDRPYAGWAMIQKLNILSAEHRAILETRRYSVYDGRFHMILDEHGKAELYDVSADPRELVNLATTNPTEGARLEAVLRSAFQLP